ncbi:DUF2145 domain-containing protein [Sneathiella sp. P13V-1]|uniref:DUF2145 domain-containing protein n=1 Tax=Sneathiella sp. P13V-1 TaxID=2697366 RepID=UPI00187B4777|nr:DUF2145 domain-containing protein [Sneathiella sp. P13V-1]MBE7637616.1 DUF2145 domain-containing protein [Sneathiella sp. P13V-1]
MAYLKSRSSLLGKMIVLFFISFIGLASAAAANEAPCKPPEIKTEAFLKANKQSQSLLKELNNSNTNLVLVSRIGSDISSKGLKYTHMGVFWRGDVSDSWKVTHLLNFCESSNSDIYEQGILDFYMDDPFKYDTLITIPQEKLRKELHEIIRTGDYKTVVVKKYNMIANPRSETYANSNQFILEMIGMAQGRLNGRQIMDRKDAQDVLQENAFKGSVIRVRFFEALFGGLFKENVTFKDHPTASKEQGRFEFVSVKSVVEYLMKSGQIERNYELAG